MTFLHEMAHQRGLLPLAELGGTPRTCAEWCQPLKNRGTFPDFLVSTLFQKEEKPVEELPKKV